MIGSEVQALQSSTTKTLQYYSIDSTLFHAIDSLLKDWYVTHPDHNKQWIMSLKEFDNKWIVMLSESYANRITDKAVGYSYYYDYCIVIYGEIIRSIISPSDKYKSFKLYPPDRLPVAFDPPEVDFYFDNKLEHISVIRNNLNAYMDLEFKMAK